MSENIYTRSLEMPDTEVPLFAYTSGQLVKYLCENHPNTKEVTLVELWKEHKIRDDIFNITKLLLGGLKGC